MDNKSDKRRERSLAFFTEKKCGKYKRRKIDEKSTEALSRTIVRHNVKNHNYFINFVITDFMLILADKFMNVFPSALEFIRNLKRMYVNSNIIMYTYNKIEIDVTKKTFLSLIDIYLELDKNNVIFSNERPILYFRKLVANKLGTDALSGPNVLLTKSMNADNNKQYDIVKDIRRFYVFDKSSVTDVDYKRLLEELKGSIDRFLIL